jgi:hypothetical protein
MHALRIFCLARHVIAVRKFTGGANVVVYLKIWSLSTD